MSLHRLVLLSVVACAGLPLAAQTAPDSAPAAPPEATPANTPEADPTLDLHALLVAALNTNLEIRAKRIDPQIGEFRVSGAWGAFDPSWVAGYSYISNERPQNYSNGSMTEAVAGGRYASIYEEDIRRTQTGLVGKLPTGTQYELLTGTDQTINTSIRRPGTNVFGIQMTPDPRYTPEYTSTTTLTITQPLLKDFGFKANLAEVRLQKAATQIARHELETTVQRVLRDVTVAALEMAFGQENIRVKQEAVSVAEALVRDNQRRFDEGRMAPIDITQSQARLSEAREELLLSQNFLAGRRNTLREITRDNFDESSAAFLVDPSIVATRPYAADRDRGLASLFERNPAYLAAVATAKSEDIRVAYAKNQRYPRVDLKASIGYIGMDNGYLDSYRDYSNRSQPNASIGVVVNVPIGDRTGKARLAEARSRKTQALYSLKRTEITLLSAFDNALREITNAQQRNLLVADTVRLARNAVDVETKRLASGLTTSYNVAQAQRDFSSARSRELAALVDLNKAIIQYHFVVGTLPEHLRVDVTTAD
jgi:outer membrane protein TolC